MLNDGNNVTPIDAHEHWADYAELEAEQFAPHSPTKAELNAAALLVVFALLAAWTVIGGGVYWFWQHWSK